jgi:hypothetical protein
VNAAATREPRPDGRQPVALRELAEGIQRQLEWELRSAGEVDTAALFVKAFWLRAGNSDNYGWPDYAHAYVWVAPVLMNPKRCEVIETFVAKVRGVTQTGCGGDDKTLWPFVFAVVDLQARSEVQP